ncbi:hypothetical protein N0V90_012571 [Kalmusia sp. IMI 367209]|nr:hypothetical protein N0V90_012571 [Kalmusia sp. IMI 367209]
MDTYQYGDLPQIPFPREDTQFMMWSHEHMALRQASTMVGEDYGYIDKGNSGTMRVQAMERFLLDSSPLTPGLLHANLHHGMHRQHQTLSQYQPWPTPELTRYDSPDRTSISGYSSSATQNETRSPRAYPAASYGSPEDYVHSTSPYPTVDHLKQEPLLPEFSHSSGNVTLRDLEYEHESEPEPTVEEGEATTTKMDIDGTYEPDPNYTRIDTGPAEYKDSSDATVSSSLRDAESVQPMDPSEGESSDADYTPNRSTRRRRSSASSSSGRQGQRRRSHTGRKSSLATATPSARVTKRGGRSTASTNMGKMTGDAQFTIDPQRHFPCPLAMYGCMSTFSSKNEWKRHVSTQHIKLGFWRCDLCATTLDPNDRESVYHNDFNRKDLFTQHLRRMHAAPPSQLHRNQKEYPVTEDNIVEHQKRCFKVLRQTPTQSSCLYCDETFTGPGSWENRMEHIGRHLEKDRKAGNRIGDADGWKIDKDLERWLFDEGIITHDKVGKWKIGDGRPRRHVVGNDDTSDEDA